MKDFLEFREEKSKNGKSYYYVNPQKYQLLTLFGSRIFATMRQPTSSIFPGKITPISMEEEKERRTREQEEALKKMLEEKGILKKFETYYAPGGGASSGSRRSVNPF